MVCSDIPDVKETFDDYLKGVGPWEKEGAIFLGKMGDHEYYCNTVRLLQD